MNKKLIKTIKAAALSLHSEFRRILGFDVNASEPLFPSLHPDKLEDLIIKKDIDINLVHHLNKQLRNVEMAQLLSDDTLKKININDDVKDEASKLLTHQFLMLDKYFKPMCEEHKFRASLLASKLNLPTASIRYSMYSLL